MKFISKIVVVLALFGSTAAFAVPSVDSIHIKFGGTFFHSAQKGGISTSLVGFKVKPFEFSSLDPKKWILKGSYDYDFSVINRRNDREVRSGFGSVKVERTKLGVMTPDELLDPSLFFLTHSLFDPIGFFGGSTLPDSLPVQVGKRSFEYTSLGFGEVDGFRRRPLRNRHDVIGFFAGSLWLKSKPLKSVPDAGSTATLGLLAVGMIAAGKRFTRKRS